MEAAEETVLGATYYISIIGIIHIYLSKHRAVSENTARYQLKQYHLRQVLLYYHLTGMNPTPKGWQIFMIRTTSCN